MTAATAATAGTKLPRLSDDRAWLASPRCDSNHTVWMQLHEDLVSAVGVKRADEARPG